MYHSRTKNFPAFKMPYYSSFLFLWLQCGPIVIGLLFFSFSIQHPAVPEGLHGPHFTCFDCFQEKLQVWPALCRCCNWDWLYVWWSAAAVDQCCLEISPLERPPQVCFLLRYYITLFQRLQNLNQLRLLPLMPAFFYEDSWRVSVCKICASDSVSLVLPSWCHRGHWFLTLAARCLFHPLRLPQRYLFWSTSNNREVPRKHSH